MAEKITTPEWQRLEKVINHAHMTVNKFALHIGLKRSENLYQIKKGNHGISKELATRINSYFPEFTISWLLTGENPPEKKPKEEIKEIPVYGSFCAHYGFENIPVENIVSLGVSLTNGAEIGINNVDMALSPIIPPGALVLVRPFKGRIIPGNLYLILTDDFALIRKIRPANNKEELRLIPINTESYDDIILPIRNIKEYYSVEKIIYEP